MSTELPPLSLIRRSGRFSLRPRAAGQLGNVGRLQKMRFYMIANTEHQLLTRFEEGAEIFVLIRRNEINAGFGGRLPAQTDRILRTEVVGAEPPFAA